MPRYKNDARAAEFARRLEAAMRQRGWSQSDLARATWGESRADSRGYSQPVGKDRISVYLKGRVLPDAQNLQKLASALETTVEELAPIVDVAPANTDGGGYTLRSGPPGKSYLTIINKLVPTATALKVLAQMEVDAPPPAGLD